MRRAALAAFFLVGVTAASGCNHFGFGTPYPGASTRYREFDIYRHWGGSVYELVGRGSETGGGGAIGGLAGIRIGGGNLQLGERDTRSGMAIDARLELSMELKRWLGVGVSGGWGFLGSSWKDEVGAGDHSTATRYYPVAAHVSYVPWIPFLLRATAGYAAGASLKLDDAAGLATSGYFYGLGAGLTVPFPGAHFAVVIDWQHMSFGDVVTELGSESLSADLVLWQLWYVM